MATFGDTIYCNYGVTGLAATIRYRVIAWNGSALAEVVNTTVGMTEYPTGSGNYWARVTVNKQWDSPIAIVDDATGMPGTFEIAKILSWSDAFRSGGAEIEYDDTLSDNIDNVLTRLGAGTVRIIGQVVGYDVIIGRGESYNTTVGQTLVFTKATGDSWPSDITGATITLNAAKKANNTNSGTATLQATGTVVTATGDSQSFRVDLTAAETTALAEGRWTHSTTITIGSNVKAIRGNMQVLPELPVDA